MYTLNFPYLHYRYSRKRSVLPNHLFHNNFLVSFLPCAYITILVRKLNAKKDTLYSLYSTYSTIRALVEM